MDLMIGRAFTAMLLAGGLALTGCAAPTSYAGISLVPGTADPELQNLAQMARTGDKQAQLELGIRFEEGVGVDRDLGKARKQYRQAASDSGGTIWVYQPPVKKGGSGRVIPIYTGLKRTGLLEAKDRLTERQLTPVVHTIVQKISAGAIEGNSHPVRPVYAGPGTLTAPVSGELLSAPPPNSNENNDCPVVDVNGAINYYDPMECVIAVARADGDDLGPSLRAFLARAQGIVAMDLSCTLMKQIYADVIPANLACAEISGGYAVYGTGVRTNLYRREELLARPGFEMQRNRGKYQTVGDLQPPIDSTFQVESVIFKRSGFAGRLNFSVNTGALVDGEIVFWGM